MTTSGDYQRMDPGPEATGGAADGTHAMLMHLATVRPSNDRGSAGELAPAGGPREARALAGAGRGGDRPAGS